MNATSTTHLFPVGSRFWFPQAGFMSRVLEIRVVSEGPEGEPGQFNAYVGGGPFGSTVLNYEFHILAGLTNGTCEVALPGEYAKWEADGDRMFGHPVKQVTRLSVVEEYRHAPPRRDWRAWLQTLRAMLPF